MQKILVDKFVIPEESKTQFLERARTVQSFLKTLPGFVEGFLYELKEGEGRHNFMTTAVWENEEVFENAKKAVAAEFQKRGVDPREAVKKLNVQSERAVYERAPY